MSLEVGQKLAHYEILEPIGKGGMGEVFRARDTKLDREVAIKVLPEELAKDEERVARFEREAKLLASLNHPNIASIHGFESNALVLELVEGPTLAERIQHGPIPVEDALPIATQIAEALEAGHEAGVVHRDLKPANIKVRDDGTVKVLDYGLAKALEGESASGPDAELSQSPTRLRQGSGEAGATGIGVILGTAAYMSPEQAKGKKVDRRADIWAFGAVLYEMLTGSRAFAGEDVSDTLAAVLRADIDWDKLPAATPPSIRRLLRRCLTRDPRTRQQHVGDARLELIDATSEPAPETVERVQPRRLPWVLIAAVATLSLGLGALATYLGTPAADNAPVRRFAITLDSARFEDRLTPLLAIPPDGESILYVGADSGLHRRAFDQLDGEPVAEIGQARHLFFSPDGRWTAFFDGGELRKTAFDGNPPIAVADVQAGQISGAAWFDDDTIVFADRGILFRVPSTGGEPVALESGDDRYLMWPSILPDGKTLLASQRGQPGQGFSIWTVPVADGEPSLLIDAGVGARYVPTGHIVFQRGDTLYGQRFDPDRRELIGPSRPLIDDVLEGAYVNAAPQWTFGHDGTLVYTRRREVSARALVWVALDGREEDLPSIPQQYLAPRLSPDGRRIAVAISSPDGGRELWTLALDGGAFTRLTFAQVRSTDPVWSPDSRTLAFAQLEGGNFNIVTQLSSGIADPVPVASLETNAFPRAWTPDGRMLLFERTGNRSVGAVTLGDETSVEIDEKPYEESQPAISPDGSFVAYASNESGQFEIFLRRFPDDGRKWQVSTAGGREPVFSPDGSKIYYRENDKMMAAEIRTTPDVQLQTPSVLFEGHYARDPFGADARNYDITPDGERFLMIKQSETPAEIVVVLNWFRELEELVPN